MKNKKTKRPVIDKKSRAILQSFKRVQDILEKSNRMPDSEQDLKAIREALDS